MFRKLSFLCAICVYTCYLFLITLLHLIYFGAKSIWNHLVCCTFHAILIEWIRYSSNRISLSDVPNRWSLWNIRILNVATFTVVFLDIQKDRNLSCCVGCVNGYVYHTLEMVLILWVKSEVTDTCTEVSENTMRGALALSKDQHIPSGHFQSPFLSFPPLPSFRAHLLISSLCFS